MDLSKDIARYICLAQIASDAGKNTFKLSIEGAKEAKKYGYHVKDSYILTAIKNINKLHSKEWGYFVLKAPDQNGTSSKIIYFLYRENGMRLQISFHSFSGGEIKKMAEKTTGMTQRWDHKSSRKNCQILKRIFNL